MCLTISTFYTLEARHGDKKATSFSVTTMYTTETSACTSPRMLLAALSPFILHICQGWPRSGSLGCTSVCPSELLNGQTGESLENGCVLLLYQRCTVPVWPIGVYPCAASCVLLVSASVSFLYLFPRGPLLLAQIKVSTA